jgi:hypothetical protein
MPVLVVPAGSCTVKSPGGDVPVTVAKGQTVVPSVR